MLPFRMRYLLLSSCLLITIGCTPAFKKMQVASGSVNDLRRFQPNFTVALYNTSVDVVGNHLSGLLIIKKMPDSSTRMVFSNEVGFKFFDFGFTPGGDFKVYSIVKQMDKKPVLKTLRKDFELIMMQRLDSASLSVRKNEKGLLYYIFPQTKGYNFYITDSTAKKLIRLERASNKKTVVEATMQHYLQGVPDSIHISHKTFQFTIALKRIER